MFYYCSYCEERFLNPQKLKFHSLESHHNDFKKINCVTGEYIVKIDVTDLNCKICSVFVPSIQELIKHLKDEHEKKFEPIDFARFLIPFKFNGMFCCAYDNCDASFNTYQGVIKHMNTHLANYVCEMCNSSYSTKVGLALHVKSHTGDKPKKTPRVKRIKCPHCDFVSKHSHGHGIHMKEAHGLATSFKCTSCDREFKNSMHLRVHVKRDHLMERNYKCPFCEKSFFYRTKLNNHLTTHTGERRFQCHVCDKRFKTKYNLTIHNRIHTNDKRYKCRVCGKAYAQRSWVNAHIKSKHADVEILEHYCIEEEEQC